MKKSVLITGGSGFIGTNLVNHLINKGYIVHNVDKISDVSTPEKFKPQSKNYFFYKFDISNKLKLNKLLKKNFHFIIHLAAESHVDRSIDGPLKFYLNNVKSNLALYETLRNLNKKTKLLTKVIHISTDEVYGSIKKGSFKENSMVYTSSPYSSSKASSESIAQSYSETFNINVCILRITNNYGPYQHPEKFIPKSILRGFDKKKIPLYGRGENIREWIYVEDTCEAIHKVIKKFTNQTIYNIGSNERISNLKTLKIILNNLASPYKNILFVKDRPGHDFRYALNSRKFKNKFKWKNKTKFTKGIVKTIKWYNKNYDWLQTIRKKYKDIRLGKNEV